MLQKIIYRRLYCAVEHSYSQNQERFIVSVFSYENKELAIVNSEILTTFDEAVKNIPKNTPVVVCINNSSVLSKTIDSVHEMNTCISLAFPNIKTSDFYMEMLPQANHTFVSIARRIDINSILKVYERNKVSVIGFSLGNNSIGSILPYISNSIIYSSNSKISIANNLVIGLVKTDHINDESFVINELEVPNSVILNFAHVVSAIAKLTFTTSNFTEKISNLKNNYTQKRLFFGGLKAGLGFMLTGLLFNFLFYTNYSGKINTLLTEQSIHKNYKDTLLKLTAELDRKKTIVKEITTSTQSRVSKYMDEIGYSTPATISLSQLYFQPLKKSIKPLKEIEVDLNTITISGESKKSSAFTKWISLLEQFGWVSRIEVMDYGIGTHSKTSFELKIILKE